MKYFDLFLISYSDQLIMWTLNTMVAAGILVGFYLLFRYTKDPIQNLLRKWEMDEYLIRVLTLSIYKTVIAVVAVITALSQLGINVIAALTGFGIAGIAIGFAAKDTLSNVISGLMIFWDKPFRVNDWIEVNDHFGQVSAITLRSTRIHTTSNYHIVIPNQIIANTTFVNHHHDKPVRKKIYFYIPYDSDVDLARDLLKQAASEYKTVLSDPKPSCSVSAFEGARIKLTVLVWCACTHDAINTGSTIRKRAKELLDEHGFGIPYDYNLSAPAKPTTKRKVARKTTTKK